jgi:hypothetical protein
VSSIKFAAKVSGHVACIGWMMKTVLRKCGRQNSEEDLDEDILTCRKKIMRTYENILREKLIGWNEDKIQDEKSGKFCSRLQYRLTVKYKTID